MGATGTTSRYAHFYTLPVWRMPSKCDDSADGSDCAATAACQSLARAAIDHETRFFGATKPATIIARPPAAMAPEIQVFRLLEPSRRS
jgi:hypothetical protein